MQILHEIYLYKPMSKKCRNKVVYASYYDAQTALCNFSPTKCTCQSSSDFCSLWWLLNNAKKEHWQESFRIPSLLFVLTKLLSGSSSWHVTKILASFLCSAMEKTLKQLSVKRKSHWRHAKCLYHLNRHWFTSKCLMHQIFSMDIHFCVNGPFSEKC